MFSTYINFYLQDENKKFVDCLRTMTRELEGSLNELEVQNEELIPEDQIWEVCFKKLLCMQLTIDGPNFLGSAGSNYD